MQRLLKVWLPTGLPSGNGRDNQQIAAFREGFEVGIGRALPCVDDNVRVFGGKQGNNWSNV
jgi:hypothetical protein